MNTGRKRCARHPWMAFATAILAALGLLFVLDLGRGALADGGDDLEEQAEKLWNENKYSEAADAYRRLREECRDHPSVKSGKAQFWLWCSLGNAGKVKEEIAEIERFLKDFPKHDSCGYSLYFLGTAHRKQGDEGKAREAWERLLKEYPDDSMARLAKKELTGETDAPPDEAGSTRMTLGDDFIDYAEGAARWLRAIAVEKDGGLTWPEYDKTKAKPVTFYDGSSGTGLFFLNMFLVTGNRGHLETAKMAADHLLKCATRDGKGASWASECEGDDGAVTTFTTHSLYSGAAGIGWFLLAVHDATKSLDCLNRAREAADWLLATAQRADGKCWWDESTDIISGPAGIGLFLLKMHAATGEKKYLDCAVEGGEWLVSQAVKDGEGLKWRPATGQDRFYTGFSHGTAGIAYFLAKLSEAAGEKKFLQCAEGGARWLIKNGVVDGDGLKWFHYEPERKDKFQTGWCHGPAGTCRLFMELHRITRNAEYLETAGKGARWLMTACDPLEEETVFHGLSMCCGAAGIGDFFLDFYLATGDDSHLEFAARIGSYLMRRARSEKNGKCWTNCDTPDEKGNIYCGTGHMVGTAGVGSFLLRLHAFANSVEDRFVSFADKPQVAAPARAATAPTKCVVLTNAPKGDPCSDAATKLAKHRGTFVTRFDVDRLFPLRRKLRQLQPRYVCFVLKPQDIDANLQRRMLAMSTRMDDDPFCDFAYGFITGRAPQDAVNMIDGMIRSEKEEPPRTIVAASVASDCKSFVGEGADAPALELGYKGKHIYWGCIEGDPDVVSFVATHIRELQKQRVLCLYGCGDPEGIWLFSDERNSDSSKHWKFDPEKVGQDPNGEMPRITADRFRGLDFCPAVVWSGTCHSGVPHRAFVEDDIVSTFGTVDNITEYIVPEDRSLCLAILGCGPSAFLGPIGANHGFSCTVEIYRAMMTGMSLGDVMRSRYNEILLGAGSKLDIHLFEPGEPHLVEDAMRGGGANRLLYGDPMYVPFKAGGKDWLKTEKKPLTGKSGFVVQCEVLDEQCPYFWDMFGADPQNSERIYTVVELTPPTQAIKEISASAKSPSGEKIATAKCSWGVEQIDGKALLHLQVNAARETLAKKGTVVEFAVGW
ncbi:MAG: lanthionine synthetase LanC family protein [Planctomycetota bacterium]|nr:lanthionine synthetase LanC family protein [Planctomycetota bacterium]